MFTFVEFDPQQDWLYQKTVFLQHYYLKQKCTLAKQSARVKIINEWPSSVFAHEQLLYNIYLVCQCVVFLNAQITELMIRFVYEVHFHCLLLLITVLSSLVLCTLQCFLHSLFQRKHSHSFLSSNNKNIEVLVVNHIKTMNKALHCF